MLLRKERQQILLVLFDEVNAAVFRHTSGSLHIFALLAVLLYSLLMRVTDADFTDAVIREEVLGFLAHFLHGVLVDSSLDKTGLELITRRVWHHV